MTSKAVSGRLFKFSETGSTSTRNLHCSPGLPISHQMNRIQLASLPEYSTLCLAWFRVLLLLPIVHSATVREFVSDVQFNSKQNLADLHWLPIRDRIHFKTVLLAFKSITTHQSKYLSDLLQFRTSSRHLRSSDRCLLHDARARTVFGSRMFCHTTLTISNSRPADLTDNFNNMLCSYLVLNAASTDKR